LYIAVDCRQVEAASMWEATTEPSTRSVSRWSTRSGTKPMKRLIFFVLFSANLWAQLPEGPGREETERLCHSCHDLARSVSRRQDRDGWQATLNKMVAFGTKGTDREFALILDYLAKHFPAEELPPVNVNKAAAIELESRLSLRRSQAAAIIAYRAKNGKFKSIEDLKKVPGVDAEKIEAKKDRIVF
jgi:competence protein ComEA